MVRIAFFILVCLVVNLGERSYAQNDPPKDGRYYERIATAAYRAKHFDAFLENMQKATQLRPNHPRLTYNLAVAYALNGRSAEALSSLRQVAEMGLVVPADKDDDFDSIKENAGFTACRQAWQKGESNEVSLCPSDQAIVVRI
jgi:tetratricopeptide (TPR) repeat protein